jgi:secreted trypsin-like serine protease
MLQKTFIIISIIFLSTGMFAQTKIVNGSDANITDFPWQIALEAKNDFLDIPWIQSCGGSIIGDSWILTAAHCVFQLDPNANGVWDFRIRAGIELLSSTEGQTINVDEVYIHPQFDMLVTTGDYDIALLHLETPLTIDNIYTKVISIVSQQDSIDGLTDPGVMGILSGWGNIDPAGTIETDRLQYLEAPIYSLDEANQPSMWDGELEGMHLPVLPTTENSGVCMGDSGGPFVVPNQDNSEFLLAGLMSFIHSTTCGDTDYADILTRVSVYESWINSTIDLYTDIPIINQSSVNIYPNPTTGVFQVESKDNFEIEVFNNLGRLINRSSNNKKIDISTQPKGIYLIRIKTNNQILTIKLIKK